MRPPASDVTTPVSLPDVPPLPVRHHKSRWISVGLWMLVVALFLAPIAGALAWSVRQSTTYAAEVELLHSASADVTPDLVDRQLATHEVLILRRQFLEQAAAEVGRDPEDLIDDVSAEVVEGSSVLRLQVVDTDPDRALATAEYLADEYSRASRGLDSDSAIGTMGVLEPPDVLDEPVGPQPLRAAAAGALVGLVLVVALLALLRLLRQRRGRRSLP